MAIEHFRDTSMWVPEEYAVWYDLLLDQYFVLELESMRLAQLTAEELFKFVESRTIEYGQQDEPPPLVEGNGGVDPEPTS